MPSRTLPARVAGVFALLSCAALMSGAAAATPALVRDINPGAAGSAVQKLLPAGGRLFLVANDGLSGYEPWASDGTLAGTSQLQDIWVGVNSGALPGCPTCNAITVGGVVYFSASNGVGGSQLWRSDGTPGGTVNVYAGASAGTITAAGGILMFSGTPIGSALAYLYRSDGTPGGTARVVVDPPVSGNEMTAIGGTAYFAAGQGNSGWELWRSDGTETGTSLVKELAPGSSDANPTRLTNVGGTLFFMANDGTGNGLYKSDGTDSGTVLLKRLTMLSDFTVPSQLVAANGIAYLIASDGSHGYELWRSDGTPAGTQLVKDVYPGSFGGLDGSYLVAIGNVVYFAANDAVHGTELWKSDGTEVGTVMVKDIDASAGAFSSSSPAELANVNGTLYFRASAPAPAGTQPWRSDGTTAGTVQVAAVYPGGNSLASSFTAVAGNIFFAATDGVHGLELWVLAAGATDVAPLGRALPASVSLAQNFPNPFNPRTVIAFDLPAATRVNLRVYDLAGRLVRTLLAQSALPAGSHEEAWDGRDEAGVAAATGLYVYRLEAGDQVVSRSMLLVK